jgi:hypothetical protein
MHIRQSVSNRITAVANSDGSSSTVFDILSPQAAKIRTLLAIRPNDCSRIAPARDRTLLAPRSGFSKPSIAHRTLLAHELSYQPDSAGAN